MQEHVKLRYIIIFVAVSIVLAISILATFGVSPLYPNMADAKDIVRVYGCEEYGTITIHCDWYPNRFESHRISSNSSVIYESTDRPHFVSGINSQALSMRAESLKSITFNNTKELKAGEFSLSFWIKGILPAENTESPQFGHIISQFNDDKTSGWAFEAIDMGNPVNQSVRFTVFNVNGDSFNPPLDIPINNSNFTHITGVFENPKITIYKDGKLFSKTVLNGTFNNSINVPLRLGVSANNPMSYYWSGIIDELYYYNNTISESTISQLFNLDNSKADLLNDNIIGYWPFDNNLEDKSGNNHNGSEGTLISSMVFAPDGRLFFSEKDTGNIRIMKSDKVLEKPLISLPDVYSNWEQGLLGIAVDPEFEDNHYIYSYYTALDNKTDKPYNKLIRITEQNNNSVNVTTILDNIPAAFGYHSGGALAFGPDDKLYVTVGDATQSTECGRLDNSPNLCPAQNTSSLLGKVLRINRDGSIPADNPYPNSPVYNVGHMNMYGIAFDSKGYGLVSENNDMLYDEINTVIKGGNYGAPDIQPLNTNSENATDSIKSLRSYYIARCLTQIAFYDGDKIPFLKDKFLVGNLVGNINNGYIYALKFDGQKNQIVSEDVIHLTNFPHNEAITIAMSPDGDIYYAGYSINKINSVNIEEREQVLFPFEVQYPQNLIIDSVDVLPQNASLIVEVSSDQANMTYNSKSGLNIKFMIPNKLLGEIKSIKVSDTSQKNNVTEAATDFKFQISNSTIPDYKNVDITLNDIRPQQITISGSFSELD